VAQERFSDRHGFAPSAPEIGVRHDAPRELRGVLVDMAYAAGLTPKSLRPIVCQVLMRRPDEGNWSSFPNVDGENRDLLDQAEWFEVYDVIEAIYDGLPPLSKYGDLDGAYDDEKEPRLSFTKAINAYFLKRGIGWQLVDGHVEVRGPEVFEVAVHTAVGELRSAGLGTAANEIHEALSDLARRPEPDLTGAVHHALASLECVARSAVGDSKATLGQILGTNPGLVPRPLDDALEKIWGYGSQTARHVREGSTPSYEEAEFVVLTCAATATYLSRKFSESE